MVITRNSQYAPIATSAECVRVFEHIHAAIYTGPLAIPHTKHAIVLGAVKELRLLTAPYSGSCKLFIDPGLEVNIVPVEARFGLQPAGAIGLSDASSPSAGRLATLKQQIAQNDIACIFTEPQLNSAVINALDNASIPTIEIDPLGRAHATGPGLYTATLRAMGQAFASCLSGN